jgi:4'-phosphopantetheinyl transferase
MERLAGRAAEGLMAAAPIPVQWWTPEGGFGAGVHWDLDGPAVIGIDGYPERDAARLAIRSALRAALALACGVPEEAVALHAADSGEAPWAVVTIGARERQAWLSITHDGAMSLAAFRFEAPVGIDLMRIVPVPDWHAVAHDYLGPEVLARFAALPAGQRDAAFARAWCERESRLKSLGWQLREWKAEDEAALQACTCLPVQVPAAYIASLALA